MPHLFGGQGHFGGTIRPCLEIGTGRQTIGKLAARCVPIEKPFEVVRASAASDVPTSDTSTVSVGRPCSSSSHSSPSARQGDLEGLLALVGRAECKE